MKDDGESGTKASSDDPPVPWWKAAWPVILHGGAIIIGLYLAVKLGGEVKALHKDFGEKNQLLSAELKEVNEETCKTRAEVTKVKEETCQTRAEVTKVKEETCQTRAEVKELREETSKTRIEVKELNEETQKMQAPFFALFVHASGTNPPKPLFGISNIKPSLNLKPSLTLSLNKK